MADLFELESRSLTSQYVFYKRLKEDGHQKLYNSVLSRMQSATKSAEDARANVSFILAQANKEREKELALIERMTGHRPSSGDWGADSSNVIDAINLCINSKDIYDRIYQTIMAEGNTHGKGMFSFFGGYLQSAINVMWPEFMTRFTKLKGMDIPEEEIDAWLKEKVLPYAIQKMFDAKAENGADEKLQSAYQELAKLVGTFDQTGSFAQQIGTMYDIEGVAKEIKEILGRRKTKKKPGSIKSLTKDLRLSYSRSGLALEAMVDLQLQAAIGNDGKSLSVGNLGAKADNILIIDLDISDIQSYLEDLDFGTRYKNVESFEAFGRYLKNFQDGFVVYVSDKNYTLNDGFRSRGGYSSGTSITLEQYQELMRVAGKNVHTFVGAIEQLAKGAIGDNMNKSDFADIISKNIAYLLFDDFDAIGAGLTNGPASIHMVNVNGLFIPISSVLYALADAIQQEESIKGIVRTSIKLPEIKYPEGTATEGYPLHGAWEIQKEEMLNQGQIETHFLGNLRRLLEGRVFR